jgi:hypothetical protein
MMKNWHATPKATRYGGIREKSSACRVRPVPHMTEASRTEMRDPWFTHARSEGLYTPAIAAIST